MRRVNEEMNTANGVSKFATYWKRVVAKSS